MSDEDRAQAIELQQWELNNKSRPAPVHAMAPGDPGYGPEFCVVDDCGVEMPAERRAWGFSVCTSCKAAAERKSKQSR